MDQFELSQTTPHNEPCAQVGDPNYTMYARMETRAFINQLIRENGTPPEGVEFRITKNPHDFGTYLDVAIRFDENEDEQADYAYKVEGNTPEKWDVLAIKELKELGYPLLEKRAEEFEVAVFDDFDDSNAEVIIGGLSFEEAEKLAKKLFATGKHYGVEIIDSDPDNMESIVWIAVQSETTKITPKDDDEFIDPAGGRGLHSHV